MVAYPMQQMAAFRRTEKRQSYGLRIKACSSAYTLTKRTGSLKQLQLMSVRYDKSCQLLCNALLSASSSVLLMLPAVGLAILRTQLPALLGGHLQLCTILTGLLKKCCAIGHVRSQRLFLFRDFPFQFHARVMNPLAQVGESGWTSPLPLESSANTEAPEDFNIKPVLIRARVPEWGTVHEITARLELVGNGFERTLVCQYWPCLF